MIGIKRGVSWIAEFIFGVISAVISTQNASQELQPEPTYLPFNISGSNHTPPPHPLSLTVNINTLTNNIEGEQKLLTPEACWLPELKDQVTKNNEFSILL